MQFGEQLSFKLNEPQIFQMEEPAPIEFKNNVKPGMPKPKLPSKAKKGKKNVFFGNIPDYLKPKKRPGSAVPKKKAEPSSDWN